jgi:hypothetical protein
MDDAAYNNENAPDHPSESENTPEPDERAWSGGEFFDPAASHSVPRTSAQRRFLLLAGELYSVTADLRDSVLPYFPALGTPLDHEPLKSELKKWCDRHRLGQPWVLRQVADTLNLWKLDPQVARLGLEKPPWHPLFHLVIRRLRPEMTEPFGFSYVGANSEITPNGLKEWTEPAGWYLELEWRQDFEAEARRQFEKALLEYCTDQERKAAERGLIRVKRTRSRKISGASKMTWTVQRQCGQMGFEEIAQAHFDTTEQVVDISTIIKKVNEISRLIDLDY